MPLQQRLAREIVKRDVVVGIARSGRVEAEVLYLYVRIARSREHEAWWEATESASAKQRRWSRVLDKAEERSIELLTLERPRTIYIKRPGSRREHGRAFWIAKNTDSHLAAAAW